MSTWIKSHQSLREHPKTRKLAKRLGGLPKAIGHLHCLWWWAMDYAPDGDLTKFDAEDIAIGAEWEGEPEEIIGYLVECGFLDNGEGLCIHDWDQWVGAFLEQEARRCAKNRAMRDAYADGTIAAVRERDGDHCRYCGKAVNWSDKRGPDGATYDHVFPGGPTTIENLVVCCRSCNSLKRDRTPKQAGLSLYQVEPKSRLAADLPDRKKDKKDKKENAREDGPVDNSTIRPASRVPEDPALERLDWKAAADAIRNHPREKVAT